MSIRTGVVWGFGRGFHERLWLLAWERLGVSSYWLVSMERVDAIEEMVFCSVIWCR